MYGKYAMMATGFGIVQINISDCEISNTYNLGFNVNYCYVQNNTLYAASKTKGIYKCPMTDNLLDPNNWKWHSAYVAKQTEENNELKELVSALLPGGPKNNNFGGDLMKERNLWTALGLFGLDSVVLLVFLKKLQRIHKIGPFCMAELISA